MAMTSVVMGERHVVAMGGGGFSMDGPRNLLMDDFVLGLARRGRARGSRRRLKVCFVPTASGDAQRYLTKFYAAFPAGRTAASHLALFARTLADPAAHLLAQDVVYVGGGNTANMLAVWRVHGVDAALRRAWAAGVVMCGISAGALCWFEGGVTDSFGALAPLDDGLGVLGGTMCPHYDGEAERRPTYTGLVGRGRLAGGYAADDGAGLHFVGRRLAEVVASRRGAAGYRVERVGRAVAETRIEARYLGA